MDGPGRWAVWKKINHIFILQIPFELNDQNKQIHRDRKGGLPGAGESGDWGMAIDAKEYAEDFLEAH